MSPRGEVSRLDLDTLREIAALQDEQDDRQCRPTQAMNFGLEIETADTADMPAGTAALAGADTRLESKFRRRVCAA